MHVTEQRTAAAHGRAENGRLLRKSGCFSVAMKQESWTAVKFSTPCHETRWKRELIESVASADSRAVSIGELLTTLPCNTATKTPFKWPTLSPLLLSRQTNGGDFLDSAKFPSPFEMINPLQQQDFYNDAFDHVGSPLTSQLSNEVDFFIHALVTSFPWRCP